MYSFYQGEQWYVILSHTHTPPHSIMCINPLLKTVHETAFKIKNDTNNVVGVFRL